MFPPKGGLSGRVETTRGPGWTLRGKERLRSSEGDKGVIEFFREGVEVCSPLNELDLRNYNRIELIGARVASSSLARLDDNFANLAALKGCNLPSPRGDNSMEFGRWTAGTNRRGTGTAPSVRGTSAG